MTHEHPWRLRRAIALWVALGLAAFVLLPWYFLQSGGLGGALAGVWGGPSTASGWTQAWSHHRVWLASGLAGLLLAGTALLSPHARWQGLLLCSGAALGLAGLLLSGFAIGMVGWSWD